MARTEGGQVRIQFQHIFYRIQAAASGRGQCRGGAVRALGLSWRRHHQPSAAPAGLGANTNGGAATAGAAAGVYRRRGRFDCHRHHRQWSRPGRRFDKALGSTPWTAPSSQAHLAAGGATCSNCRPFASLRQIGAAIPPLWRRALSLASAAATTEVPSAARFCCWRPPAMPAMLMACCAGRKQGVKPARGVHMAPCAKECCPFARAAAHIRAVGFRVGRITSTPLASSASGFRREVPAHSAKPRSRQARGFGVGACRSGRTISALPSSQARRQRRSAVHVDNISLRPQPKAAARIRVLAVHRPGQNRRLSATAHSHWRAASRLLIAA